MGRRRDRAARASGTARRGARPHAADRRLPLRVHRARSLRRPRRGHGRERRDARAPRPHGRQPRRGGRRRGLPERHDGRPGRRDPHGPARHADRLVRREVRVRVLRPVPRGRGVGARVRRPARIPDGPRERARGPPRERARPRRGRGHPHGQARAAVPRRDPGGAGALRLPGLGVPGLRGVCDGARGGRCRPPRGAARGDRVAHRDQAGRRRDDRHVLGEGPRRRGSDPVEPLALGHRPDPGRRELARARDAGRGSFRARVHAPRRGLSRSRTCTGTGTSTGCSPGAR